METTEIEVWVLIDSDGDYEAGINPEQAGDRYDEEHKGSTAVPKRLIQVKLTVPLPRPITLTGSVPAELEGGELKVA